MASVIKLKRSTTGGSAPSGGALQAGELAINLADRKLFSSTDGSDIITISGDRYNIDTQTVTHTGGGATIRLTKVSFPILQVIIIEGYSDVKSSSNIYLYKPAWGQNK